MYECVKLFLILIFWKINKQFSEICPHPMYRKILLSLNHLSPITTPSYTHTTEANEANLPTVVTRVAICIWILKRRDDKNIQTNFCILVIFEANWGCIFANLRLTTIGNDALFQISSLAMNLIDPFSFFIQTLSQLASFASFNQFFFNIVYCLPKV